MPRIRNCKDLRAAVSAREGVIADDGPVEQEKAMRFDSLLTNAVIFHNALDLSETVRRLLGEGREIDPEDLAA
ncbi:hypothetical protein SUDANB176_00784 [Streptomyces sp. enrichment culture]|uniref:Tn3 family transposase n=1 Tax=Streptomyces sp. enrichment culture TaxID=1795815 RepID=UPI003F57F584